MSDSPAPEQKNEYETVAAEICEALGEKDYKPKRQIYLVVEQCGIDFARKVLEDTQEIEAKGGMLTHEGTRRRTPGGVYFHLAREGMDHDSRQLIFYSWRVTSQRQLEREMSFDPFDFDDRAAVVANLLEDAGKVEAVRVTLVGRPEKVERRQQLVILQMRDEIAETIALPTGVPRPDPAPMDYTVYVSFKHWDKVEEALENPKDEMMLDGFCAYDEETKGMAIFATYATTRKLHRKERKANKRPAQDEQPQQQKKQVQKKAENKPTREEAREARVEEAPPQPPAPEVQIELPSGIPADAAQKLMELHKAAATFREKIAGLEDKPPDQRFGLEMTRKLLANTASQIEKLEQEYADEASKS